MITNFEPVKAWRQKNTKCPVCDKKLKRSKTFEQTINPWNKNEDSSPKTDNQVRDAVNAEADAWMAEPEYCKDHHMEYYPALRLNETEPVWRDGKEYAVGKFRELENM